MGGHFEELVLFQDANAIRQRQPLHCSALVQSYKKPLLEDIQHKAPFALVCSQTFGTPIPDYNFFISIQHLFSSHLGLKSRTWVQNPIDTEPH